MHVVDFGQYEHEPHRAKLPQAIPKESEMTSTTSPTQNYLTWIAKPGNEAIADFDSMSHWHETLRDGTRVLIRPIEKDDAALERAFLERLSPESREYRFLGQMNFSNDMIKRLTDIDYRRDMAFVALRHEAGETREIGVSRFCISDDGTSCECAVAVADEWQGKGLGSPADASPNRGSTTARHQAHVLHRLGS
jgi:hypothetical protein